uniref:Peptidase S1 domain-containing protein n=1 Tax=Spermophilus dauricus TaxID=99837 RepID=A0A8C9QAV8_SPEDA
MASTGIKRSGIGRQGLCMLATLLFCLCLQPLHAQNTMPNLSEGKWADARGVCGRTRFTGKIFGGQNAEPEQWPWQASVFLNGTYVCGAALIDSNWVASAAHCFQRSQNPDDYWILLGYNRMMDPSNYSMQMAVSQLIVHPDFDKHHFLGSDITLMQLHVPVNFNSHVLPACLPESSTKPDPKSSCWISGWGMTLLSASPLLRLPFNLQSSCLKVSLLDNEDCNAYYRYSDPNATGSKPVGVFDDMVCAGDPMNGTSICRGDSGGPLVCPLEGVWYLFGLSSWSQICQSPIGPSVFTNLSYFAGWIKKHKKENPAPDPGKAPPVEKAPALSTDVSSETVLKPRMTVLLFAQFLLLWLSLVSAQ